MAALAVVFSRLLSMAVAALPVMALVLAVRAALGRAPARYRYGLWLAVGFRLACPVSVERLWSLYNLPGIRAVAETTGTAGSGVVRSLVDTAPSVPAVPPAAMNGTAVVSEVTEPSFWELVLPWCAVLWVLGVLAVLIWGMVSAVRLRRTVREAVSEGGEVWTCGAVPTPFVLGLLRPRIYLPPHLDDTTRTYVLAHERHHIRRHDPWWKLLGWCLLAVYWWNPAVWLCWVLFCRDMEMSCDEAVLDALGSEAKRGYSLSLVAHAAAAPMPAALAFGEHDATRRVKNVLAWKKATPRMAFLAAAAAVLAVTACLGNGMTGSSWVRMETPGPMIQVSWDLKEPIRAWALYADVYAYGTRTESRLLTCGELTQQSERTFTGTLYWDVPFDEAGGFSNTMVGFFRGESWNLTLPQPHYTGVGSMTGQTRQRLRLDETGGTTLVTIYLSDKEGGGTAVPASGDPILTSGGVRLRLATSQQGVEAFAKTDLAVSLHALHTPALGDDDAAALLEALETDMLDRYTFTRLSQERALEVEFESGPYDENALDASMLTRGALLMALADDLQEVRWSYPVWATGDGGRTERTVFMERSQADAWARNMGYEDLRNLGQTQEGIRDLLAYLGTSEQ
ncbi:M56 family metallopeptidase [uncultured Oscillibacter sp.]|uniref:M56 family metallopeptidase n=1 Tax=uncultured Oscillibacter sp. TaxID=876091 RepID=UPI00280AB922|nr:M56 family metallopeptidase [uncultured Oscillibacter sp.]